MKITYKPWTTGIKDTTSYEYKSVPTPIEFNDVEKIIKKQNSIEILNNGKWHTFTNTQSEIKTIEMTKEERNKMADSSIV